MDKKFSKINKINDKYIWLKLGFPTERDSATFWDKGTEVISLSRDKGRTGQAKNIAKGPDRPGQPVKIWYGTVQDFDSLSQPTGQKKTEQKRIF